MSLNFDYHLVPDHITTSPFDENKIHPVTNYLIWSSLLTGISSITKANVDEVFRRIAVLQKLNGSDIQYMDPISHDWVSIYLTRQDIENHIGLWTNASSLTDVQFDMKIMDRLSREATTSYVDASAHDRVQERHERWLTAEQNKVAA
jgi:hypothetical protein